MNNGHQISRYLYIYNKPLSAHDISQLLYWSGSKQLALHLQVYSKMLSEDFRVSRKHFPPLL